MSDHRSDLEFLRARALRKLRRMTASRVSGLQLADELRRRACTAEAVAAWLVNGGRESGRPYPELRAQDGEDVLLWGLFGGADSGFYIEAGASDGYALSVSYLFECVGWTGVLVEPLEAGATACVARRPNSRTVQAALSTHGAPAEAPFTQVTSDDHLSYLTLTDTQRRRLQQEQGVTNKSVVVPVTTLDEILDGYDGVIDFVSLDIEGGELDALGGFNLERWRPRALLIEDNSLGSDRRVPERLDADGYTRLITAGINDLYLRRGDEVLQRRLDDWWGPARFPRRR